MFIPTTKLLNAEQLKITNTILAVKISIRLLFRQPHHNRHLYLIIITTICSWELRLRAYHHPTTFPMEAYPKTE